MVLHRLGYWITYCLIAIPLHGQVFNRNIIAIRPEASGSPVGQLRFYEATAPINYVGFKAPATIAANIVWQLPSVDGSSGNCLGWSSAGVLGWVTCSSAGSGLTSLNGQTGATQTFTNDTNVTIVSAVNAHVLTWAGTLAKARQNAATAYIDAANTWSTGAQDFSAATSLKVPVAAGAAPATNGLVAYDSTAHTWEAGVNGANKTFAFIDGNIATATAFLNNPSDCGLNEFANAIAANGNLTCAVPPGSGSGGGAAENTFATTDVGVTVTHALGTSVVWECFLGTAPNYTPMLVNTVVLNSTTTVFTFAAAPSAGKCVVSAGGSGGGGGGGNVSVTGSTTTNNIPYWSGTGGTLHNVGIPYSTTATADSIMRRLTDGSIVATGATLTNAFVYPASGVTAAFFRRGTSGQTAVIAEFANELGGQLSAINNLGGFTGNAATATALAINKPACLAGRFVTDMDADGTLTCDLASSGFVSGPGSSTAGNVVTWSNSLGTQIGDSNRPIMTTTPTANAVMATDANKATTIRDKGGQVWNVLAYSASPINDGSTAARTAIQAALDACQTSTYGGTVYMPPGIYAVDGNLNLGNGNGNTTSTQKPCTITGAGNGVDSNWLGATVIRWTGAAPGATDYIVKMNGPSIGGGVGELTLDVNSKANLRGMLIENVSHGHFSNLSIIQYATIGMVITSRSTAPTISFGSCDSKFYGLKIVNNVVGGSALLLDGNDVANGLDTCSNGFFGAMLWHDSGTVDSFGVKLGFTDNNRFYDTNIYSFASTGAGTVSTSGTSITGVGTSWTFAMTGAIFRVNSVDYAFTYISPTSGTISPSAPVLGSLTYTIRGLGRGISFLKATTNVGFPTENHFNNTSAHNGVGGTTGVGPPSIFTGWNQGDCGFNCDPYAMLAGAPSTSTPPVVSGTDRTMTGVGAIRQVNPTTGTYATYWNWGDDVFGTKLYHMKRGSVSTNGLEIWAYDDFSHTNPGSIYHNVDNNSSNSYYTMYSSAAASDRYGIQLRRARGSEAAPSNAVSGDRMSVIGSWARANGGFVAGSTISAYADIISGASLTTSLVFANAEASGNPTNIWKINAYGGVEFSRGRTKAELDTLASGSLAPNGSLYYCSDCAHASTPCTASSTGAIAKRLNGAWQCN